MPGDDFPGQSFLRKAYARAAKRTRPDGWGPEVPNGGKVSTPEFMKVHNEVARKTDTTDFWPVPPRLPNGFVFIDHITGNKWKISKHLTDGRFSHIYEATCEKDNEVLVFKTESTASENLHNELHFVYQCLTGDKLQTWATTHQIPYVPLPKIHFFGTVKVMGENGTIADEIRFSAMSRLGLTLDDLLDVHGGILPKVLTYQVAVAMIDALEYIHTCGYIHNDMDSSNIMFGYEENAYNRIYLCDFGLSTPISVDSKFHLPCFRCSL